MYTCAHTHTCARTPQSVVDCSTTSNFHRLIAPPDGGERSSYSPIHPTPTGIPRAYRKSRDCPIT